jgi:xylose isomerase
MPLPATSTRLNSMGARPDLWPHALDTIGRIRRAATVPGLDLVDLNYPQHVVDLPRSEVAAVLADTGLGVGAMNLRFDDTFLDGAYTHPDAGVRRRAIALTVEAGEWALELGARQIIVWPGQDGYDYPFQVDYQALWSHTVEAFQAVADALPEVTIALEYKPLDPRRFAAVGDMSTSLLCVRDVARDNVGVALDVAHALMARENPAQAAARALRDGKLFGIHLNDAYGQADDGLMVGSVHPVQTLELLWTVQRGGYDEHIYFDTFPVREDPVGECARNIVMLRRFWEAAASLDEAAIADAQSRHDALRVHELITLADAGSRTAGGSTDAVALSPQPPTRASS